LRGAARAANGVILSGRGIPGATVRLASPTGPYEEALVDAAGAWRLKAPAGPPALYGLSQAVDGRRVHAEGYIAILPGPGPVAVELRSGVGALVLGGAPGRLSLVAADTDASGVVLLSGWAGGGRPLRVSIDGAAADEGVADAAGRFALSLPKPLSPGEHAVRLESPTEAIGATIDTTPAPPMTSVLRAAPRKSGWRLDWATPAGGIQTTELFAAPGTAS
jgi:hypothetical protein